MGPKPPGLPHPPSCQTRQSVLLCGLQGLGAALLSSLSSELSYSVVLPSLVQRNVQFILGEAVISNIIYVLHRHSFTTPYNTFQSHGSINSHLIQKLDKDLKA